MAKLTDSQIKALRQMTEHYGTMCVRFQTGESLLKRGLAERYTQCVIAADYVTHKGAHPQGWCSKDAPAYRHEWYITLAGRAALQEAGRHD